MLSSFNIQYKASQSDNILVLAQCKSVKVSLANVREVIWFSNDQDTHAICLQAQRPSENINFIIT